MSNDTVSIDRQTLEDTIRDLCASKELLIRERDTMDGRVKNLGDRIQSLQAKLDQAGRNNSGKKSRLRKGEGVVKILSVLNGVDGLGLSQAQIVERTGIPGATVFRILKKNEDRFQMGPDNLWRKKGRQRWRRD